MRQTLLATLLILPGLAGADDFPLPAPVTAAEIYLQGATLTRTGSVDLPAGSHRLLMPWAEGSRPPRIALTGATAGAVEVLPGAIADPAPYLSQPQRAALADVDAAEAALAQAEDARMRTGADLEAAEAKLAFWRSLTGADVDPDALLVAADAVASGVRAAQIARADAQAALRAAGQAVEVAETVLEQARIDAAATGADVADLSLLAVSVTLPAPATVELQMETFLLQAGWSPLYDVTLGADDTVTLDRLAEVWQRADLPLAGIAVTLSTADPFAQTAPAPVFGSEARLEPEVFPMQARSTEAPAPEAMMADAAPVVAIANLDGPVVTYDYPAPVTVPLNGSVTLALDRQTLDARVFNRANPRRDTTAFLMAEVANSTGEPLLAGPATLYREGARIGESAMPLLPAGDEVELAFGPQEHLRLEYAALDNDTGDRGLLFTSGIREQDLVFRVRNLSETSETVETLFALPYSEAEDLEIAVTAIPAPDARDVEDRRGVARWDLDVAPGTQIEVAIGVTLEWPEGETLYWQP